MLEKFECCSVHFQHTGSLCSHGLMRQGYQSILENQIIKIYKGAREITFADEIIEEKADVKMRFKR